jgi:hypothetical protein
MEEKLNLKKTARLAGLFFFLTAITTLFGLLYVRSELINFKDATETANNIMANNFLFRAGIAVNILCQVFHLFLAITLFELFKNVHRTIAQIMFSSKLISLTLAMAGIIGNFAALHLLSKSDYLASFTQEQINGLTMLFLRLTNEMQGLLEIFWMPTNFCIGLLIIKSRFIPKILGYLMILGSFGFAINVFIKLLLPGYQPGLITMLTMILGSLGGLPIMFWLLIFGTKEQKV